MNRIVKYISITLTAIILIIAVSLGFYSNKDKLFNINNSNVISTQKTTQPTTKIEETTISIGNVGDILIHSPIFRSAYNSSSDTYDFNNIFKYVKDIYSKFDYMVANLEQPIAGEEFGYSGFPLFNAPDSIVDALKENGVDMVLTASNHSYDKGKQGFYNTIKNLKSKNIDFIGIRNEEDKPYLVKDIKGIKVGMINYTYETQKLSDTKYINGIPMDSETATLINSFDYNNLDAFYADISGKIDSMYNDGAEAIIVYMHWGTEYLISANEYQKKIAQKLCDIGVDAIIGGHTHCLEPIDMISSTVSGKQTPIIYSTGNQLSNQRKETISHFSYDTPYCEDGVIYSLEFTKKSNGSVVLSNVSYTATWCNVFGSNYYILPLDKQGEFKNSFSSFGRTYEMENSLKRSQSLFDEGIEKIKTNYKQTDLRKKAK